MSIRFTQDQVQIQARQVNYQGFMQIQTLLLQHPLFSGSMSPILQRELCCRKPAVGVLPYDPKTDCLVLIEQFRVGALAAPSPWLFEIVAGIHDQAQETSAELAAREAKEEAGLELLALEFIAEYWVSPGACDEKMTLFCGLIDSQQVQPGIYGNPHEQEDIQVHCLKFDEVVTLYQAGQLNNATTLIAWFWLQMHRNRLRAHAP